MIKISEAFKRGKTHTLKWGATLALFIFIIAAFCCWLTYKCYPEAFWDEYMKIAQSGKLNDVMKLQPYMEEASTKMWVINFVQYFLGFGVLNVAISEFIGETKGVSIKYMSLPFATYLKLIEYICIMILLMMIGIYTAFIPTVYFGIRTIFYAPLVLENPGCSSSEAFKASWKMTDGNFFKLLGFSIICLLLMLVGFCFCMVGACYTSVICIFAFLSMYEDAKSALLQDNEGE